MRLQNLSSAYATDVSYDRWDEDDLIDRLCQSLDFAERAIRLFDEEGQQGDARPEKLITETAVLLLAASNVSSYSAVGPRILRVASLLVPHARSQRMMRGICLEPALAFDYATAHICLKRLGFYDSEFDAMLDLSAASQASDGRERAPHRMLEQDWLKQGWLYPEGYVRLRASSQLTHCVLNRTTDLLHGTREDFQCFTEALMYLRDFNLFPRPLPRPRQLLLTEAEGMLARCLEEQDYDLAAQILMAWPLTGCEWSPAATFAFRVLARVERAAGMLPASTIGIDRRRQTGPEIVDGREGEGRVGGRRYFVTSAHHAVYVMGMLCAAVLAPGRIPPRQVPSSMVRAGAFDAVLDCLEPDGHEPGCLNPDRRMPRWQQELDELAPSEREPLAEFMLSMALHRAFGQRDFAAIQRLLTVGTALGLTGNPVATQAAEMMGRMSQFALFNPLCSQPVADSAVAAAHREQHTRRALGETRYQAVGA